MEFMSSASPVDSGDASKNGSAGELRTLTFGSARELSELYAGDTPLLREVEARLNVRLTSRDNWVKIEGTQEGQDLVAELFNQLLKARGKNISIRRHEFRYVLSAICRGEAVELSGLWDLKIAVSGKRPPLIPKTFSQKRYVQAIQNHDLTLGIGSAGTGKTFLAMAMAVAALKNDEVSRIILTRPAVEAGEALGYLPGDLEDKVAPYLRPLYDALHEMLEAEEIQKLMAKNIIEIAPLAYMRGRTLGKAFIILDEAQNTTTEQMFMFLTRIGMGSKCVVTGDATQIDLPRSRKSGLIEALQALQDIPTVAAIKFADEDIVRHELVNQIVEAYRRHRGERQTSISL